MWLLETSARDAIRRIELSGFNLTAEQFTQITAASTTAAGETPRLLTVAGASAQIEISGVITKTPSWVAVIFGGGGTTYPEIIAALRSAEQDPNVQDITLAIDSPGGSIDGLFDTIAALQATTKPITAHVSNVCASAAFALASQADSITASNVAVQIGSVGIAATVRTSEHEVVIASTDAPRKRPDVATDEGVAMVREELDALHEIFVEAIAVGRGTTTEKINAEFGQGGIVLAGEAVKRGMIDSVATSSPGVSQTTPTTATSGNQPEANNMDLKTLQAQHPETYAAAVQSGANEERDRVTAHLTMGEASGDMKTASAAIKEGEAMTATLQAKYMTAGMHRNMSADRQDDSNDADAGDNANESDDGDKDPGAAVAAIVEARLGLGGENHA